jgi:spermidine synthase
MIRIAERKSVFGVITIFQERRTGSLFYNQGGFVQSAADNNGVSLASYIHAIYGLLCQADSQNILMIGGGGGTLATMLWKSGRNVTVVDVNPQAFLLARKYFGLPSGIPYHVADGCEFLLSDTRVYDAIVLDAFAGAQIPAHVRSPAFFRLARTRLNCHGCMFVNVHVMHDLDNAPDRMSATLATVWPDVRLLDIQGCINRNAIAMAGAVRVLKKPELYMRPQISADEIDAKLKDMEFRLWRAKNSDRKQ